MMMYPTEDPVPGARAGSGPDPLTPDALSSRRRSTGLGTPSSPGSQRARSLSLSGTPTSRPQVLYPTKDDDNEEDTNGTDSGHDRKVRTPPKALQDYVYPTEDSGNVELAAVATNAAASTSPSSSSSPPAAATAADTSGAARNPRQQMMYPSESDDAPTDSKHSVSASGASPPTGDRGQLQSAYPTEEENGAASGTSDNKSTTPTNSVGKAQAAYPTEDDSEDTQKHSSSSSPSRKPQQQMAYPTEDAAGSKSKQSEKKENAPNRVEVNLADLTDRKELSSLGGDDAEMPLPTVAPTSDKADMAEEEEGAAYSPMARSIASTVAPTADPERDALDDLDDDEYEEEAAAAARQRAAEERKAKWEMEKELGLAASPNTNKPANRRQASFKLSPQQLKESNEKKGPRSQPASTKKAPASNRRASSIYGEDEEIVFAQRPNTRKREELKAAAGQSLSVSQGTGRVIVKQRGEGPPVLEELESPHHLYPVEEDSTLALEVSTRHIEGSNASPDGAGGFGGSRRRHKGDDFEGVPSRGAGERHTLGKGDTEEYGKAGKSAAQQTKLTPVASVPSARPGTRRPVSSNSAARSRSDPYAELDSPSGPAAKHKAPARRQASFKLSPQQLKESNEKNGPRSQPGSTTKGLASNRKAGSFYGADEEVVFAQRPNTRKREEFKAGGQSLSISQGTGRIIVKQRTGAPSPEGTSDANGREGIQSTYPTEDDPAPQTAGGANSNKQHSPRNGRVVRKTMANKLGPHGGALGGNKNNKNNDHPLAPPLTANSLSLENDDSDAASPSGSPGHRTAPPSTTKAPGRPQPSYAAPTVSSRRKSSLRSGTARSNNASSSEYPIPGANDSRASSSAPPGSTRKGGRGRSTDTDEDGSRRAPSSAGSRPAPTLDDILNKYRDLSKETAAAPEKNKSKNTAPSLPPLSTNYIQSTNAGGDESPSKVRARRSPRSGRSGSLVTTARGDAERKVSTSVTVSLPPLVGNSKEVDFGMHRTGVFRRSSFQPAPNGVGTLGAGATRRSSLGGADDNGVITHGPVSNYTSQSTKAQIRQYTVVDVPSGRAAAPTRTPEELEQRARDVKRSGGDPALDYFRDTYYRRNKGPSGAAHYSPKIPHSSTAAQRHPYLDQVDWGNNNNNNNNNISGGGYGSETPKKRRRKKKAGVKKVRKAKKTGGGQAARPGERDYDAVVSDDEYAHVLNQHGWWGEGRGAV